MGRKLAAFIHTTPPTISMVETFIARYVPNVDVVHMYNGLVKRDNFASPVGITPKSNLLRYADFAKEFQAAGCDIIVSCCSLMRRATKYAAHVADVPFIQLDAVVLDTAADNYQKIGVINTTEYVVSYVTEHLNERAQAKGKKLEIIFSGNIEALKLFNAGDFENHDRIVLEDMKKLQAQGVDCILMGQIPFGLMEEKIKAAGFTVPVLLAGEAAFKHIAVLLGSKT